MDELLSAYLERTGEECPNCGRQLDGRATCEGCHHTIWLGLDTDERVSTLFTRTWAIFMVPWFILLASGIGRWFDVLSTGTASLSAPDVLTVRSISLFYLTYVVLASPAVCIYAWVDRQRVGAWPGPAMWIGFGIPALAYLLSLLLTAGAF